MALVRVRQHVNPLSQKYQQPVELPIWERIYVDYSRPLHLDIGCGRGSFLLQMAHHCPEWNFLGLEIREPLVGQANEFRDELGLTNLHFFFCNANTSLALILQQFPSGVLQRVSIQFPDPWFKKRHRKRRVVQPQLVNALAHYLADQGEVFLQSDIEEVAVEMRDRFLANPAFVVASSSGWLPNNPLPFPTEREEMTLESGKPVFRTLLINKK